MEAFDGAITLGLVRIGDDDDHSPRLCPDLPDRQARRGRCVVAAWIPDAMMFIEAKVRSGPYPPLKRLAGFRTNRNFPPPTTISYATPSLVFSSSPVKSARFIPP